MRFIGFTDAELGLIAQLKPEWLQKATKFGKFTEVARG
jgi:hypothetical protein